jgi:hypothetical protein
VTLKHNSSDRSAAFTLRVFGGSAGILASDLAAGGAFEADVTAVPAAERVLLTGLRIPEMFFRNRSAQPRRSCESCNRDHVNFL